MKQHKTITIMAGYSDDDCQIVENDIRHHLHYLGHPHLPNYHHESDDDDDQYCWPSLSLPQHICFNNSSSFVVEQNNSKSDSDKAIGHRRRVPFTLFSSITTNIIHLFFCLLLMFMFHPTISIAFNHQNQQHLSAAVTQSTPPSLIGHMHHGQQQTQHSPTAAIVRRLYYAPATTTTTAANAHHQSSLPISIRTNPYRSMVNHHHHSHSNSRTSIMAPNRIRNKNAKGVAKVTPISIQSATFDSTVRLTSRPVLQQNDSTSNVKQQQVMLNGLLQKPSTSLIQVLDSNSNQTLTTTTITPPTLSSTISSSSHRQGKSLQISSTTIQSNISETTTSSDNVSGDGGGNLCFLSHGGSSETFTVNEAMPINSVIGTIKVIGDATENGDIDLFIIGNNNVDDNNNSTTTTPDQPPEIPIRIEPGTKKLILVRKLDKESVEGESSVTIGVRCRPKQQQKSARKLSPNDDHQNESSSSSNRVEKRIAADESATDHHDTSYWTYRTDSADGDEDIIIPIRILVTDANDNKPEWQGQIPYSVNISEMATIGSVVMTGIKAIDNDQLGPYSTVEYYVEPGPYSHLVRFSSPLEGTLILAGQLDYETLPKFWVSIRAQDQGNPPNTAITTVNIQLIDADDQNPRFEMDKYTAILAEGQTIGHPLQVKPKPIRAEDPDRAIRSPIVYEFNSKDEDSRENTYFKIDSQTGQVSLKRPLHSSVSLPITLVIRATQLDNRDRYALTTLTIMSKRNQMMPELRFLHSNYSTSLLESTPPGQVALTVQISQPSAGASAQPLRFQILDDDDNYFSIKNTGEIVVQRMVDYEKHHRYSFRVMVSDGRQTDLARITIDIINVNEHDPIFGQSNYVFHVNEARLRSSPVIGQIQATDADDGDRIQLTLSGPHAGAFALSIDGTLRLRSLRRVNQTECHMIVTATDSGQPPRSSSASVVVKFAPALLKSLAGRTLESLLFELEQQTAQFDLSPSSPTAVDILQHSAANIFSASTNSSALVLVIVLGVLLGTLFIIIVALTLHVLKNRKFESSRRSSSSAAANSHHHCSPITASLHPHQRHHHHHSSSASSTTSSASSSSELSLSGAMNNSAHSHHHHHNHNNHHQHSPKRLLYSAQGSTLFQPTTASVAMLRSNKIVPSDPIMNRLSSSPITDNNNIDDIDSKSKKLLDNLSPLKRPSANVPNNNSNSSIEQPDSAISSDLSCWSDSHHKIVTQTDHHLTNSDSNVNVTAIANANSTSHSNADESNGTVASRISVIRWPQGSIPRRVKKLTWKDEQRNNHLDQLYTSNSIVKAPPPTPIKPTTTTATKTKTLSGHLLTGTTTTTISPAPLPPLLNGHGHYHLQQQQHYHHSHTGSNSSNGSSALMTPSSTTTANNNNTTVIRHHQTPHYPVTTSVTSLASIMDKSISKSQPTNDPTALPDLTVYF